MSKKPAESPEDQIRREMAKRQSAAMKATTKLEKATKFISILESKTGMTPSRVSVLESSEAISEIMIGLAKETDQQVEFDDLCSVFLTYNNLDFYAIQVILGNDAMRFAFIEKLRNLTLERKRKANCMSNRAMQDLWRVQAPDGLLYCIDLAVKSLPAGYVKLGRVKDWYSPSQWQNYLDGIKTHENVEKRHSL